MYNIGLYHSFVTIVMVLQVISSLIVYIPILPEYIGLVLVGVISFIAPVFIYSKISGQKFLEMTGFKRLSLKNALYVVVLSVLVYPAVLILALITSLFFHNSVPEVLSDMGSRANPIAMFVIFCLSPAVCEEICFRGFLGSSLKRLGYRGALLNGLYFGLIHLNFHQFFYAFALGILLYYMMVLGVIYWLES